MKRIEDSPNTERRSYDGYVRHIVDEEEIKVYSLIKERAMGFSEIADSVSLERTRVYN